MRKGSQKLRVIFLRSLREMLSGCRSGNCFTPSIFFDHINVAFPKAKDLVHILFGFNWQEDISLSYN